VGWPLPTQPIDAERTRGLSESFTPPPQWRWVEVPSKWSNSDAVLLCKLRDCRALAVTVGNHALLAVIEPLGAPKLLALTLGALNAFLGAAWISSRSNSAMPPIIGQDKHSNVARGVTPTLSKRYEAAGEALQFMQDVVRVVAARTRQAVELGHHHRVSS
jgi:hypothetical protein